jgi:hypothetical protein
MCTWLLGVAGSQINIIGSLQVVSSDATLIIASRMQRLQIFLEIGYETFIF